jgi:hypothetical protein
MMVIVQCKLDNATINDIKIGRISHIGGISLIHNNVSRGKRARFKRRHELIQLPHAQRAKQFSVVNGLPERVGIAVRMDIDGDMGQGLDGARVNDGLLEARRGGTRLFAAFSALAGNFAIERHNRRGHGRHGGRRMHGIL